MNEYDDLSSSFESASQDSGNDWILSTSSPSSDTSSYSDSDYLQSIYEVNLANTAFSAVIMFIIIIAGFSSLFKNFFD